MSELDIDTGYYVYYNKETGALLSATNEKHLVFTDKINVSLDVYERLVSGKDKFSDYRVGEKTSGVLSLIPIIEDQYNFKNKRLHWIKDCPDGIDIKIEWHGHTKVWKFSLVSKKITYIDKIMIFVVLDDDLDFLVRSFKINVPSLLNSPLYIPFDNKFEEDISKISVTAASSTYTYGLITLNE